MDPDRHLNRNRIRKQFGIKTSILDLDSMNTNPDPDILLNRDPDPDQDQTLYDKKFKK